MPTYKKKPYLGKKSYSWGEKCLPIHVSKFIFSF